MSTQPLQVAVDIIGQHCICFNSFEVVYRNLKPQTRTTKQHKHPRNFVEDMRTSHPKSWNGLNSHLLDLNNTY